MLLMDFCGERGGNLNPEGIANGLVKTIGCNRKAPANRGV
jgi:hypothetical protein